MSQSLPHVPNRFRKPRKRGLTMVMDKGLSVREAEDMISSCGELVDLVKFGFGTSYVTQDLDRKIAIYKEAGCRVYLGGTLFEAYLIRGMVNEYRDFCIKHEIDTVEISDGSISISHQRKCKLIKEFSKDFTVLSEVGSKEEGIFISPQKWISMMNKELEAGSWKVIAEARESGTVGIYRPNGTAHSVLVNKILNKVPKKDILWEAPQKAQQVWFIKLLGANVNLGNIAPNEVIPCECLRLGLRGDTFFSYLPADIGTGSAVK
ncbi:MAG: phosphosulfolactate synthase [Flavobacteriales bacterium]|nr:phosphosulfolactate synthase [Flavobacteriales bacterium]